MTATRPPRVTAILHSVRGIEGESRPLVVAVGFALVAAVGVLDAMTDAQLSFAAIYLVPVWLVVWYGGRIPALVASVLSVGAWLIAHRVAGGVRLDALALVWNAALRLALYVVFTYLLLALQRTVKALADALEREHQMARVDPLTGVRNARAFHEAAEQEVARSARYRRPVTLAYLDADGFKAVNDQFGHNAGDRVLRVIAQTLESHVRVVDTVARLGGDEFAVLLPETDAEGARVALANLRAALAEAMAREAVAVTFCIGAVTTVATRRSVDSLLQRADALMYEVKHAGKNDIRSEVVGAVPDTGAKAG